MTSKFVEYAGPWAARETVQEYLGIDNEELARLLEHHEILGCEFSDKMTYFPIRQFVDRRVVPGLREVLEALASGITSAQTWATWLAGHPGDGVTHWDRLRSGQLERVLAEARRDVYRWSR